MYVLQASTEYFVVVKLVRSDDTDSSCSLDQGVNVFDEAIKNLTENVEVFMLSMRLLWFTSVSKWIRHAMCLYARL